MATGITRVSGMGMGKWHKGPYISTTCALCEANHNPSALVRAYPADGETVQGQLAKHMRMAHCEGVSPNLADRLAQALKPPVT